MPVFLGFKGGRAEAKEGIGIGFGCGYEVVVGREKAVVRAFTGGKVGHGLLRNPSPAEAIQCRFQEGGAGERFVLATEGGEMTTPEFVDFTKHRCELLLAGEFPRFRQVA